MPQLEKQTTEEEIVYKPEWRDSAGRTRAQARAMDLPPRSGSRATFPGSREVEALGGNAPAPPALSDIDVSYAAKVGEAYSEYPRVLYHRAFRRERDSAGKVVPNGECTPLPTADQTNPNYGVSFNVAQRNNLKGILAFSGDSQIVLAQYLYTTRFVPAGFQVGDKIDLKACREEEAALIKQGWVRTPGELNLPQPKTVEQESDE